MSSVFLAVTQEYCDKTTEARITRFTQKIAKCIIFHDIRKGLLTGVSS